MTLIAIEDMFGHTSIARIGIKHGASSNTTKDYFYLQKAEARWRSVNKTLSELS